MVAAYKLWIQHDQGDSLPQATFNSVVMTAFNANTSDETLMEAFCQGEQRAFDVLFDRYAQPITRLMLRLTGNRALAMDLMQTTFLSVVRGRGRFTQGLRFKPWLYTIAMNAMRDAFRRTRREKLMEDGSVPEGMFEPLAPDPAMERHVRRALESLSDVQREAVILHHVEGLSCHEIATMLDTTEAAVKLRAFRGCQELRARLRDTYGVP
jgi:RNA polymerase sigma factor (sigma-70 family)